jgi:hypothetical protein
MHPEAAIMADFFLPIQQPQINLVVNATTIFKHKRHETYRCLFAKKKKEIAFQHHSHYVCARILAMNFCCARHFQNQICVVGETI